MEEGTNRVRGAGLRDLAGWMRFARVRPIFAASMVYGSQSSGLACSGGECVREGGFDQRRREVQSPQQLQSPEALEGLQMLDRTKDKEAEVVAGTGLLA